MESRAGQDHQVIPAEAVEAAAKALNSDFTNQWEKLPEWIRADIRRETAAHIMATAWDEAHFDAIGCDSSCCDFMHGAPKADMNPYRTAE